MVVGGSPLLMGAEVLERTRVVAETLLFFQGPQLQPLAPFSSVLPSIPIHMLVLGLQQRRVYKGACGLQQLCWALLVGGLGRWLPGVDPGSPGSWVSGCLEARSR